MSTNIIDAAETNETPPQILPPRKSVSRPPPRQPAPRRAPSPFFLGAGIEVVGRISCESDVQIDGVLKGGIEGRLLMVGENGFVAGPVKVDDALIDGTVQGDIRAKGDVLISGTVIGSVAAHTVCLTRGARVSGNLTYEIVAIENGAVVEGRLKQRKSGRRPADIGAGPKSRFFSRRREQHRIVEKFHPMMRDRRALARRTSLRQARSSGTAEFLGSLIVTVVLLGGVLMWPTISLSR